MALVTKVVKGKLILEIDIDKKAIDAAVISKTGKSKVVATSSGFQTVEGAPTVRFSLNVIHIDRIP